MTVSAFYKSIFGKKVYKISLDAGCTCPNRDGTIGTGGCIFCSNSGSGDFVPSKNLSIAKQIEEAKKLVENKMKNQSKNQNQYIAYFQNFTNTYGNISILSEKWNEALSCSQIVGLALGTRPDCLGDEVLQVLSKLANKTFLQIELGFQTSNETSSKLSNETASVSAGCSVAKLSTETSLSFVSKLSVKSAKSLASNDCSEISVGISISGVSISCVSKSSSFFSDVN